jgi:hypothetical protein
MSERDAVSTRPLTAHAVEGDVFVDHGSGDVLMTPEAVLASMEALWRAAGLALRQRSVPAAAAATLWRGRQWVVTQAGLETADGRTAIAAARLAEPWTGAAPLLRHPVDLLAEAWVDVDDYLTAYMVALALHAEHAPSLDRGLVLSSVREVIAAAGDRYSPPPAAGDRNDADPPSRTSEAG